ncbi:MAG: hypothetical protein ACW987_20500, partial [Candidatus Thorarchaeota archaeon]
TVNYLAEDPTLLRLLPVAMGEVGAHAADIGAAGVGLYRLGRGAVQVGLRRMNPAMSPGNRSALVQLNESFEAPITQLASHRMRALEELQAAREAGVENLSPYFNEIERSTSAALNELQAPPGVVSEDVLPGLHRRGTGTGKEFEEIAFAQRGAPEDAMNTVTMHMGGNEIAPALEHVGDITNRMTDWVNIGRGAKYGDVKSKVESALRTLKNERVEEHFLSGLVANAGSRGVDGDDFVRKTFELMDNYAAEHSRLPVINKAQENARDAAIALGQRRWDDAVEHLEELNKHLGSREEWNKYAQQGLVDEVKEAPVIQFKKKEPQSVAEIFEGRDDVDPIDLYNELLRRKKHYEDSIDAVSGEGREIERKILKRRQFPDEAERLSGLHSSKTGEFVELSGEYEKILRYIQRMEDEYGPGIESLLPPTPSGPRRVS